MPMWVLLLQGGEVFGYHLGRCVADAVFAGVGLPLADGRCGALYDFCSVPCLDVCCLAQLNQVRPGNAFAMPEERT